MERLCVIAFYKVINILYTMARHDANVGDNLLPLASQVAGLLKKWLLGTHQGSVRPSHLDYCLDEFTFRFNRRASRFRGKLFYRLPEQAVITNYYSTRYTWRQNDFVNHKILYAQESSA